VTQGLANAWSPEDVHVLDALRDAEVRDVDLLYDSSNYVFVAALSHEQYGDGLAVYKPAAGEAPLSDFPYGTLHRREIAAYELSRLLGWPIVPPVVEREGPRGVGSMQLFIEHDPAQHYFRLRGEDVYRDQFVRIATFDLVANNADRKGGHLLLDQRGRIWGIDNALSFHRIDKLRTVIWDFAGTTLSDSLISDIERVQSCIEAADEVTDALRALLHPAEVSALLKRCAALLSHPVLPEMYPWRCVPWPLV
jgi:uncharacterized repeat protein (TIGR03843 family)